MPSWRGAQLKAQGQLYLYLLLVLASLSIPLTVRSKPLMVMDRWNSRIVCSNPSRCMDVFKRSFCVVPPCVGRDLAWEQIRGPNPWNEQVASVCVCVCVCICIYICVSKSFRTESITKYMLTTINTRWEAAQRVMAAKLTRLTHKIATQLHLVAENCIICSSRSRLTVRKLLDTPSHMSELEGQEMWNFAGNSLTVFSSFHNFP
jgi:hypothetical protein